MLQFETDFLMYSPCIDYFGMRIIPHWTKIKNKTKQITQTLSATICSSLVVLFNTCIICLLGSPLAGCQLLIMFQKEFTTYLYTFKNNFSSKLFSWPALLSVYINWIFILNPFLSPFRLSGFFFFLLKIIFRSFTAWMLRHSGCILVFLKKID